MGSPESGPHEKEKTVLSRRSFLRGIASVGAAAAMSKPMEAYAALDALRAKEDEAYFRRLISDPIEQQLFREGPTQKQLGMVMRSLARTNTEWVRAFKQKPGLEKRGALALQDEKGYFRGNGTILKVPFTAGTFHHVIVTAAHVADAVPAPYGTQWVRHSRGRDVAVRKLSEQELAILRKNPSNVLLLGPERDISGEIGIVDAYDNDDGSLGRKIFPSRISPSISLKVSLAARTLPEKPTRYLGEDDFTAARMIVLPAGQMDLDANNVIRVKGVSGAAFVYQPNGAPDVVFGGVFVAAGRILTEGVGYDTGYVIDQHYVRETIEEYVRNTRSIRMSTR